MLFRLISTIFLCATVAFSLPLSSYTVAGAKAAPESLLGRRYVVLPHTNNDIDSRALVSELGERLSRSERFEHSVQERKRREQQEIRAADEQLTDALGGLLQTNSFLSKEGPAAVDPSQETVASPSSDDASYAAPTATRNAHVTLALHPTSTAVASTKKVRGKNGLKRVKKQE
ncbi:hypothetical protein FISHEDRAFT_62275 [Fistulina hepatica ATCC 64428]|nr:hypothetical protein FISHEDRAFT_62275 [Fistulina hepatica ATCC 64428]